MATFDLGGLLGSNMFGGGDMGLDEYLTPEQRSRMNQQGIMALAASLLKSSGPSAVPVGIGQALGEAYGAGQTGYQQAQTGAIANIMTKQKLDEAKRAMERRDQLAKIMSATGAELPVAGVAITPDQALAIPNMQAGPTQARADMIGQVPAAGAVKQSPNDLLFNKYMNAAQLLSLEDPAKAKAYQDLAFQIKPKEEVLGQPFQATGPEGKPMLLQQYKDGTIKPLAGFGPKRNMKAIDLGGRTIFVDEDSIAAGTSYGKTLAPQVIGGAETGYFQVGGGGGSMPSAPRVPSAAPSAAQAPVAGAPAGYVPRRTPVTEAPIVAPSLGNIPGLTPLIPGTGATAASKVFSNEGDLRKEFTTQVKPFIELGQSYQKIETAAKNPSPAGDIALVYGFMKVLDPGSVVREGEFATAQNAGSVPQSVVNMYNKALTGERLGENTRLDFLSQARNIIESQRQVSGDVVQRYTDIAKRSKLSPEQVVFDPFSRIKTTEKRISEISNTPLPKRRKDWYDQFNLLPAE
jgi:hypothetical protein